MWIKTKKWHFTKAKFKPRTAWYRNWNSELYRQQLWYRFEFRLIVAYSICLEIPFITLVQKILWTNAKTVPDRQTDWKIKRIFKKGNEHNRDLFCYRVWKPLFVQYIIQKQNRTNTYWIQKEQLSQSRFNSDFEILQH